MKWVWTGEKRALKIGVPKISFFSKTTIDIVYYKLEMLVKRCTKLIKKLLKMATI